MSEREAVSEASAPSADPGSERALVEVVAFLAAALCPLILYATYVPTGLAFGDGPELLTALSLGGVPHPSGYPLFVILGRLALVLPGLSEAWNVGFYLSALPAALTSALVFSTLRRLDAGLVLSLAAALLLAGALPFLSAATRVEVYALHGCLTAATFYGLVRFEQQPTAGWALSVWGALALSLTNHLLSLFMIVPVLVVLFWRGRGKVRVSAGFLGAALGITAFGGLIYAVLPIIAVTSTPGEALIWNHPDTVERLLFHVSGAEYRGYRQDVDVLANLWILLRGPSLHFFPGFGLAAVAGAVLVVRRGMGPLIVAASVFVVSVMAYNVSYAIADIAYYLISVYVVLAVLAGVAIDSVVALARLRVGPRFALAISAVLALAAAVQLVAGNMDERHRDTLAESMSADVFAVVPPGSIVLTESDYQNFPLWYRGYVQNPERDVAVVNWSMFVRPEMGWYRDFLRARHRRVAWPTEASLASADLAVFIASNIKGRKVYALLMRPWQVDAYRPVNLGWVNEIVDAKRLPPEVGVKQGRHAYMGRYPEGGGRFLAESGREFEVEDRPLVCVAELLEGHGNLSVQVVFRQPKPGGAVIRREPVTVAAGSNRIVRAFPRPAQSPGVWVCDVLIEGRPDLQAAFELVAHEAQRGH